MTAFDDLLGVPPPDDLLADQQDGRQRGGRQQSGQQQSGQQQSGRQADRRAQVLVTLADILITAARDGRRRTMVDAGTDCAAGFADDLATTVRDTGTPCARLRMGSPDPDGLDPGHEGGIVLADSSGRAAQAPFQGWDVRIYLRTPPSGGHRRDESHGESPDESRGESREEPGDKVDDQPRRGHGDGEFGADIVVDHHDERWTVIRHVAADLEHAADRLYLDETRAFFASRALRWNDRFGDDGPAYEQAIRESDVPPGATVVDVGCGTGRALPAMRDAVGDGGVVIGIDLTPEMLTVASLQCTSQLQLVLADARRLPLADGSIDVVFAAGLVQHLPDPRAGLAELARVTRPGGRLIIFHPSGRAALAARHGRTLRDDEPLAPHQLRHLLDGSGWSLVRYDDPPHRFYALAERAGTMASSRAKQRPANAPHLPNEFAASRTEMSVAGGHE